MDLCGFCVGSVRFLYGICAEIVLQAIDSIMSNRGCTDYACFLKESNYRGIAGEGLVRAGDDADD
jgi:hypothetical protein